MTALERKQNTEKQLEALGIRLHDDLPPIEEEHMVELRTPQEVAERILILTYLNCLASEPDLRESIISFLKQEALWEKVSDEERALFDKEQLLDEDISTIQWRGESIWLLLWVINKVDQLALPSIEVHPREVFSLLPAFMKTTREFINAASIRSLKEIMDQSDLIFRLTWAIRTQVAGAQELDLNEHVAFERFYAINWVTCARSEWDERDDE